MINALREKVEASMQIFNGDSESDLFFKFLKR